MSMRTPLSRVRGLGSAKDGTEHFWRQRVTGAALAILVTILMLNLLADQLGRTDGRRRS